MVTREIENGIGIITMRRAEKRNALGPELVAALHEAIREFGSSNDVRVIILRGDGPAFCAGADLAYLQKISENSVLENLDDSTALKDMLLSIVTCPKPVIAEVHGPAIAGGCGLASVCDIVIAGRQGASFGYSEVRIGFVPAIVLVFLLRKIGDTQARRLVLSAENIDADTAHRIGLVTDVVDDVGLREYVLRLATAMAKNGSDAMALTKRMLTSLHGMSLEAGLDHATAINALARQTDECRDGIAKFVNKTSSKG